MIGSFLARKRDISGLELCQRNPTVVTLWHAAQALEVEVHLLLEKSAARRWYSVLGQMVPGAQGRTLNV